MLTWLKSIDTDIFLAINGAHSAFFDFIMFWVSSRLIWIPLYLLLAYLLYRHYGKRTLWLILLAGVLVTISDQTSVHLFKNVFHRLRPCHEPSLEGMVHLVRGNCGGQFGFVSSHATNTFAVATYLSLLLGKKIRYFTLLIFIWAAFVSYSRIYLGAHYPLDVIVGGLWGAGLGAAIFMVADKLKTKS